MNSVQFQNDRHAYLFLVCKNTYVFEKCLQLIDDYRNDIYIHVDKKCKDWDYKKYEKLVTKSNIFYTDRTNCHWAAYSLFNATILLFEKATSKCEYRYFHLMSEHCLPIKTQDYIHRELLKSNYDYITTDEYSPQKWIKYYYFFTESNLYRKSKVVKFLSRRAFIYPQILIGIDRLKKEKNKYGDKIFAKWGWQWVSLKKETVEFLLSKKQFIYKHFKYTHCPDETCISTILFNFYDTELIVPSKRNIQFNGKPSIITINDYNRLMDSEDFFARKFDEEKDKVIIDKIFNNLMRLNYEQ